MAIHTETYRYRMETTRNGLFVVITRKGDGADVHLQDEAAADAVETADDIGKLPAHRQDEFFDYWASQYDDVMEVRA